MKIFIQLIELIGNQANERMQMLVRRCILTSKAHVVVVRLCSRSEIILQTFNVTKWKSYYRLSVAGRIVFDTVSLQNIEFAISSLSPLGKISALERSVRGRINGLNYNEKFPISTHKYSLFTITNRAFE